MPDPTIEDYLDAGFTADDWRHDFGSREPEAECDADPWREHRHTAAQYGVGRFA